VHYGCRRNARESVGRTAIAVSGTRARVLRGHLCIEHNAVHPMPSLGSADLRRASQPTRMVTI